MVNDVVMEKQKSPVKDTRKKTGNKSMVKIQADSIGEIGGEGTGKINKKKKKKKKKLDPKEEYALLKQMEENALAEEEAKENPTLLDVEEVWYDCVRCMEKAELRPLIGNEGTHLCHSCYWMLHPEVAQREARGDDFKEKEVLEGEECRSCLDQGFMRRCCNEFYCHKCYLRTGYCPGCNQKNNTRGLGAAKEDPGAGPVLASWMVSAFIVLLFAAAFISGFMNYATLPETVWGYKCYGFFPRCDLDVCVDLDATAKDGLQNVAKYKFCELESTINKVMGKVCIYDQELYRQSENTLGYDFCYDVKSRFDTDKADEFNNGVFVFEDDFDHWKNKTDYTRQSVRMASANWYDMNNAKVSDVCGIHVQEGHKGYPAIGKGVKYGEGALVFTGVLLRSAITVPLDVSNGGSLNFFLKMAPFTEDESTAACVTAYGGEVSVWYSVDNGDTWTSFGSYPVHIYRNDYFTEVKEEIPQAGWTNSTMFKFEQSYFDPLRDHWAIDDVTIFHRFSPDWRTSEEFLVKKAVAQNDVQVAQCCFETEFCWHDPFTDWLDRDTQCGFEIEVDDDESLVYDEFGNEVEQWQQYVKGYKGELFVMRGADAYIVIAALCAFGKWLFNLTVLLITQGDVVVKKWKRKYLPKRLFKKRKRKEGASGTGCFKGMSMKKKKYNFAVMDNEMVAGQTGKAVEKQAEKEAEGEPAIGLVAEGAFQCVCHPKWRKIVFCIFAGPYFIASIWMRVVTGSYSVYQPFVHFDNVPDPEETLYKARPPFVEPNDKLIIGSGWIVFLAWCMDLANIHWLSKKVFCIWPGWVPEVSIDTNPRNNWLRVGEQKIILKDVKEIHRFSKKFCWFVAILYLAGGMPYCAVTMICKGFWFHYEKQQMIVGIFGLIAISRATFGADFLVKLSFGCEWLFATDNDNRDAMGLSIKRGNYIVKYQTFYWFLFTSCSVGLFVGTLYYHSGLHSLLWSILSGLAFGFYGLVLGMLQGLPASPQFVLTRFPDEGHFVQYEYVTHCPCIFYCSYCSDMNTRMRMLVLFLDNMQKYQAMLKGESDLPEEDDFM